MEWRYHDNRREFGRAGDAAGYFNVHRADNGKKLWSLLAQSGIIGAPWGGVYPLSTGSAAADSGNLRNVSRILAFKLGGTATLPPIQKTTFVLSPPPEPTDAVSIGHGELLFARYCSGCHGERGLGGGVTPDLRASGLLGTDFFYNVVLDGALKDAGMASFKSVLDRDDVTAIRNYLIHRANEDNKGVAPSAAER